MKKSGTTQSSSSNSGSSSSSSSYFSGCWKTCYCRCGMCIESIKATRDLLMPTSSFLKNFPTIHEDLVRNILQSPNCASPFDNLPPPPEIPSSSTFNSTSRTDDEKISGFGVWKRLVMAVMVILVLNFGLPYLVLESSRPQFSHESIRVAAQDVWCVPSIDERLVLVEKLLREFGGSHLNLKNCSAGPSEWKTEQDGLLLRSTCTLYQSLTEEISIWGWPLGTSGVVTTYSSGRYLVVLSGHLTVWMNGGLKHTKHGVSSSRIILGEFSATPVNLEPMTWLLEYGRSSVSKKSGFVYVIVQYIKMFYGSLLVILRMHLLPQYFVQGSHVLIDVELIDAPNLMMKETPS